MSSGIDERRLQRKLIAWWALVGVLAVLGFSAQAADEEPAQDVLYRYSTFVFGSFFYLLVLAVVLLIASGIDRREAFALRRPSSWGLAAGLAVGLLVSLLIVASVLEPVLGAGDEQGLDPTGWDSDRAPAFALNAFVTAVLGPIVEEALFRGIGFYLLAQFGQVAAIVVTAIAFALTHGILVGLPIFFIIGVGLGFIRSRTGSIYPPVLLHAGFNGIALIGGVLN
ncbi:MAG TPA: type II CAAX endopeptidase family protein [Gaiellaceae bacterium]|jgi:membrane protease YdiL (CAAX protease family)|nr:type II CAAX endopeptidase family protein [Gaiellaceae bacterium]